MTAGIASFAMSSDFRRASQFAYFADAGNVTAIPLNGEFNGKFSHTSGYLFGGMKAA
jgi:hypothetical protein